jgi:hypothetical protein
MIIVATGTKLVLSRLFLNLLLSLKKKTKYLVLEYIRFIVGDLCGMNVQNGRILTQESFFRSAR